MFNPYVDIVTAEWSPFKETFWVQPLLTQFSDWRVKFDSLEDQFTGDKNATVTFIADFPGMSCIC